jgi:hypothetical protein
VAYQAIVNRRRGANKAEAGRARPGVLTFSRAGQDVGQDIGRNWPSSRNHLAAWAFNDPADGAFAPRFKESR